MATSIENIPATIPITVTQGNTLTWVTTITVDGVAQDLTVANTVVAVVIESTTTATNILALTSVGGASGITVNASGEATVTVTAAQTAAMAVGGYRYALRWTKGSTGAIRTLHAGSFTVTKPIS